MESEQLDAHLDILSLSRVRIKNKEVKKRRGKKPKKKKKKINRKGKKGWRSKK